MHQIEMHQIEIEYRKYRNKIEMKCTKLAVDRNYSVPASVLKF